MKSWQGMLTALQHRNHMLLHHSSDKLLGRYSKAVQILNSGEGLGLVHGAPKRIAFEKCQYHCLLLERHLKMAEQTTEECISGGTGLLALPVDDAIDDLKVLYSTFSWLLAAMTTVTCAANYYDFIPSKPLRSDLTTFSLAYTSESIVAILNSDQEMNQTKNLKKSIKAVEKPTKKGDDVSLSPNTFMADIIKIEVDLKKEVATSCCGTSCGAERQQDGQRSC